MRHIIALVVTAALFLALIGATVTLNRAVEHGYNALQSHWEKTK